MEKIDPPLCALNQAQILQQNPDASNGPCSLRRVRTTHASVYVSQKVKQLVRSSAKLVEDFNGIFRIFYKK